MTKILYSVVLLALAMALLPASGHAKALDHNCKLVDVTVFKDRVHAKCSNPASDGTAAKIYFFAVPTANAAAADRFLSVAMTALVSQKTFLVNYDTDSTKNGFGASGGCASENCRVPHRFAIK